jgi:hypothetical protein
MENGLLLTGTPQLNASQSQSGRKVIYMSITYSALYSCVLCTLKGNPNVMP